MEEIEILIESNEWESAELKIKDFLKKYPDEGCLYYAGAKVAIALGKIEEATYYFQNSAKRNYKKYMSLVNCAIAHNILGNRNETIEALEQACNAEENTELAYYILCSEYMDMNDYVKTINVAEKLIKSNPYIYDGYHIKAVSLMELDKRSEAEALLLLVEQQFEKVPQYIYDYVIVLYRSGKISNAFEYLIGHEKYIDVDLNYFAYLKALIACKLYDKESTIAGFEILSKQYDRKYATFSIVYLKMADGKFGEADKLLCDIISEKKYDMNYACALYLHTFILSQIEKDEDIVIDEYVNAIEAYKQIYESDKANSFVLEFMAESYRFLGDNINQDKCNERLRIYYNELGIQRKEIIQ